MEKNIKRIYDGAKHCGCGTSGCDCPVVDYDAGKELVSIYDPAKPENGKFTMTIKEYNALIGNAPEVNKN